MTGPDVAAATITEPADYTDAFLRGVLDRVKSIAVVGASADPVKASFFVMKYLRDKGYEVIPINPKLAGQTILGLTVHAGLKDLPEPPDMVDVFRNSAAAGGVTDEAIAAGAKVVWMQLGVRNDEAAARAEAAGLTVVMDRCPKMEIQRLYGEIGRIGVNSNVLMARRRAPTKSFKKLI
ncbi:CoA-binding protein [Azospirillum picis]|uniref:CoA-binding protein n=1 Tax=Azospirillum picis TaxID=488438 RepID=A0ABU0ME14_9PROT|nr:CoA-binding protein [Azospirillum picis]MBP2297814.1 putative CoA-binding protein [Azospirillum picis]MDQ0531652.1 putative CoA-binding protein [Azospirillum picis]